MEQQLPFTLDYSTSPPSCLPSSIDAGDLIDITKITDPWRVYVSRSTGDVHDGKEYIAKAQELMSSDCTACARPFVKTDFKVCADCLTEMAERNRGLGY